MQPQPLDQETAEIKKRAMIRLGIAIGLVALAVAILTLLGRHKTETPPVATETPATITAPAEPPAPPEPVPEAAPPAPVVEAAPVLPAAPQAQPVAPAAVTATPPPPPEVINNKRVPAKPLPSMKVEAPAKPAAPPPAPAAPAKAATPPPPAPTKPAEVAKPAPAPAAPKGYVVQLGVFSNFANAQQLQQRLLQNGIQSTTETHVIVGPFLNKAEADIAQAKIRTMGIGAVVVPAH
jgi:DedD protein